MPGRIGRQLRKAVKDGILATPAEVQAAASNAVAASVASIGEQLDSSVKTVTVTVVAEATSGTGAAAGGTKVLGVAPAGNQDQYIDNVAIAGGVVTVTLAAAATADNVFKVTYI